MAEISPAVLARKRRRQRRRTTIAVIVVVGLAVIGGGIAFASGGSKAASYRTAVAGLGSVDQTTTAAGTVAYVKQATAAFATAGTVSTVGVKVGSSVKAGQTIATLDTADLAAAVSTAKQTLATDQQTLATDLASQTIVTTTAATAATTTAAAPSSAAAAAAAAAAGFGGTGSAGSGSSGSGSASGASGGGSASAGSEGSRGSAGSVGSGSTTGVATTTPAAPRTIGAATGTATLLAAVKIAQQKVTTGQAAIDLLLTGIADSSAGAAAPSRSSGQGGTTGQGGASGRGSGATSTAPQTQAATPAATGKSQTALIKDEVTACTPISTLTLAAVPPTGSTGRPVPTSSSAGSTTSSSTGTAGPASTTSTSPTASTSSTATPTTRSTGSHQSSAADPAAFVLVTPSMQSAVDDVVVGDGSPLVAANAAYLALGSVPTTDSPASSIPTGTETSAATSATVPPAQTVTATVTSTGTTTATITASGSPGPTVTVTAPTTVTVTPSTSPATSSSSTSAPSSTTTSTTTSSSTPATTTSTSSSSSTPSTPVTTSGRGTGAPTGGTAQPAEELLNCQQAIKAVLDNQTKVATAEKDQSANLVALDTAISKLTATAGTTSGSGTSSTGTGRPTGTGGGSTGGTGAATNTTTANTAAAGGGTTVSGSGTSGTGRATSGTGSAATGAGGAPSTAGLPTGSAGTASRAATATGTGTGTGTTGSGGTGNGSNSGGAGATPRIATAADIAADQAQLDLDQANIAVAAQALTTATLTSPIAGTVAAVAITKGSTVSANSTSSVITILGAGQYEVSTTIGLSLIDQLKVGDEASIAVNGITTPLRGKVTMIGVLSSSATSGSTTYPVTVLLDPVSQTLYQGSGASVDITLSEVSNVLTVPTSAVHTTGSLHSVSVLTNGAVSTVVVQVGAVGAGLTEITSGIKAGQEVVIADLNQPIASSTTSADGGLSGLGGNASTARVPEARFGGAGVRPGG